ncbi:MAG: HAMP domain-containing sensor histidine kinase [Eubacteriales bacterium]
MTIENRKQRFALTLLVSVLVFIIITMAMVLTILTVYILLRLGVITSINGQLNFGDVVLFMSLISMLIGFVLTMLSSKILLMPVNRMIDQLNRLSKGDFKARLSFGKPLDSHPTFMEIEKSFNCAAEELEHTEVLRSDFTNNFSHEFKTPIVSIAGFAKLLRHGSLTDEQKEEYLAIIEEESLRLSYMATNVLNLTKVENQTILTDVTKFNLSEQIRSAVLLLADKWAQKDLDMDIDFGEHMIYANEELLKQVWINLLDNAVKFSEHGGRVRVEIAETENETRIAVSNNGKEIPPESLSRIFNKFYQADESHYSEGNGIGLAIVKRVCELHHGKIKAESQNGKTTFTVTLPRKQY